MTTTYTPPTEAQIQQRKADMICKIHEEQPKLRNRRLMTQVQYAKTLRALANACQLDDVGAELYRTLYSKDEQYWAPTIRDMFGDEYQWIDGRLVRNPFMR